MVADFRQRALDNSKRELENTVLLLARHYDQQLHEFVGLQKSVVSQIETSAVSSPELFKSQMSTLEMHEALRAKVSSYTDVAGVNLYAADGTLINSLEYWPVPNINVADREYFQSFKSGSAASPVLIQLVKGRFSPGWAIVVAQRLNSANGNFLGVTTRAFPPANIEKFFETVTLGKEASISMFHTDGTLLARYPTVASMLGRNFIYGPVHQALSQTDNLVTQAISPIDGLERLASARRLDNFPLYIIATTTVSAALADWREQTRFLVGVAILSAVVVAGLIFLIVQQLSRQHKKSKRRLALEKQRLNTAVDNMTQGLLLFDASARLIVHNQRYVEMYGLRAERLHPGCSLHELVSYRKETGSFVGDVDAYCDGVLRDAQLSKTTVIETADGRSIQVMHRPVADGGWVTTHEDISERCRSEERIAHLAHYDALTDLPNRVLFSERLELHLNRLSRGEQFSVLYIDIDEFKTVNDSLGHTVGDELLKVVADRLLSCVRETDFVARLGGNEFAIIQSAIDHPTDVTELVTRIYDAIRQPCECLGHHIAIDASIGIALAPEDGDDIDQLLKNADLAMYGAKADGRRTYRFFERDMDERVKARRALEIDLRNAIANGGLELHYQPLVNLKDNTIAGCEALLRWRHPERGMISPAEFVAIAEETGLITQLGEWVIETACAEAATWPENLKIAVNVSPVQFRSPTLGLKVATALSSSGLAANRLEIEITEAVLIQDDDVALAALHEIKALGVRIALDDFGTGYSSLSYLQRFPFDKIKIDRCFVTDMTAKNGSSTIIQAVVNIAAARNMTTTAEGVETEQQRKLLKDLGCTEMQGYLFSPAKPAADVKKLFAGCKPRNEAAA